MHDVRGIVKMRAWKRGRLLWEIERENLIVTAGLTPISKLVGGTTANQAITVIGFGAGTAAPVVTDTDITPPAYYKAVTSVSFPTAGQAQFSWSLVGATDTGAVGLTITELAFYANTGAVSMPVARPSGAAPSLTMYAHLQWPSFTVLSGGTYTGTWTFVA